MSRNARTHGGDTAASPASRGSRGARLASAASSLAPLIAALVCLIAFVATQFPTVLSGPFVGDDYLFLEKARTTSFIEVWRPTQLAFDYYRPWSRELHYWVLHRLFGPHVVPFHAVSLLLFLTIGSLYFVFVRRLLGTKAAALTMATALTLSSWGVLLVWVAGCQDLWMIAFALGSLLAFASGYLIWAAVFLGLGLLSKETASMVPFIAFGYALWIQGKAWRQAFVSAAPLFAVVAGWALWHPLLGGRLWHPLHQSILSSLHPSAGWIVVKTLLSVVNLDRIPRPMAGWQHALTAGLLSLLCFTPLLFIIARESARARPAPKATSARQRVDTLAVARFGLTWAIAAWVPLLFPSLGWHAYYGLLGTLGMWLALSALLARRGAVAVAILGVLLVIRAGDATTRSGDWGTEWFQRRAAWFGTVTQHYLMQHHPVFPAHSRVYLTGVPGNVGLVPGGDESPLLHFWYRDSTLQTFYLSHYRPRAAGQPQGSDYFFGWDSLRGWQETLAGNEDVSGVTPADTAWIQSHWNLIFYMTQAGDWRRAAIESEKLARVLPGDAAATFNVGVAYAHLADSSRAAQWFAKAANLPGATPAMQSIATKFRQYVH